MTAVIAEHKVAFTQKPCDSRARQFLPDTGMHRSEQLPLGEERQ
jgi:hypothetical protein